jgi:peptidyl-prolyl cis-trans isomerase SurA
MIRKNKAFLCASTFALCAAFLVSPFAHAQEAVSKPNGYDARLSQFVAQASMANKDADADFIVALVNSDIVTNQELRKRVQRALKQLPPGNMSDAQATDLLRNVLDDLIFERLQLQAAQDAGIVVDARALDAAVLAVAKQNEISMKELKERLAKDGVGFDEFQQRLRNQIVLQRVRDRYVDGRTRVSDFDLEAQLGRLQVGTVPPEIRINLSQILIAVPEGASPEEQAALLDKAKAVAAKAEKGAKFEELAKEFGSAAPAGDAAGMGLKAQDRYPSLFAETARKLVPGQVSEPVRSGAGFHILKMLDKQASVGAEILVNETHARHILIRALTPAAQEIAKKQLSQWAQEIRSGKASFASLARDNSQDGSSQEGGDLGWVPPAQLVPEFENVMNGLAIDEVSGPVVSRFGVHLIQVLERRQVKVSRTELRERVAAQIREQRAEEAYSAWAKELRERAYIEFREPPRL